MTGQLPKLMEKEVAERFAKMDVTVLRAAWSANVIPPPGLIDNATFTPEETEEGMRFVCDRVDDLGNPCGAKFKTINALCCHLANKTGGTHGEQNLARAISWSTQCPICKSSFKGKSSTTAHILAALRSKSCKLDRSAYNLEPQFGRTSCPLCKQQHPEPFLVQELHCNSPATIRAHRRRLSFDLWR